MKKFIYLNFAIFVALCAGFVSCNDDDLLKNEVECEIIADTEIHELLSMLEASHAVYVTESTLTEEDANATNDVHNVHYFGSGTDDVIDKNLYKTAYKNGHFFICSERNINKLCEILDCELSVDITDDPMHYDVDNQAIVCEGYPINMPENPEDLTDEDWGNLVYEHDTTYVSVDNDSEHHECVYYTLFNEHMQMAIALPVHEHVPHLTLEAVLDAIYKHQDDAPEHRSTSGNIAFSDPIIFQWTEKYTFADDETTQKGFTCQQGVMATFEVGQCYSIDMDRDYFVVKTSVTTYNAQLKPFKGRVKNFKNSGNDFYVYAGYSKGMDISMMYGTDVFKPTTALNDFFTLYDSSPQTTVGSSSVTTGFSYNFGGGFDIGTPGVSSGISAGVTISDSRTMNIPDVMVKNYCVSGPKGEQQDQRLAVWNFEIADPRSDWDYQNTANCRWAIDDVAMIGQTTATYMTSHIWIMQNPEEYQYINDVHTMITANIRPKCGISAGRCDWLGRWWSYSADIYGDHAGRVLSFKTAVKTQDGYYSIEKNVND